MAQVEQEPLRLGMAEDQLFQKYIAGRVLREQEVEIGTSADLHSGFITGFDEAVVWLVSTENERLPAVIVNRDSITSIKETGSTIEDYLDRPDDMGKKLREYTALLRRKAERELKK